MVKFSVAFALLLMGLGGCASIIKHNVLTDTQESLQKGTRVFIATPSNGVYQSHEYSNSGFDTVQTLEKAFAKYADSVTTSARCTNITCLTQDFPGQGYYVIPVILHWDDGESEWSSNARDSIELKIMIYGPDGKKMASNIITSRGKLIANDKSHPEDLLSKPIKSYLKSLYSQKGNAAK